MLLCAQQIALFSGTSSIRHSDSLIRLLHFTSLRKNRNCLVAKLENNKVEKPYRLASNQTSCNSTLTCNNTNNATKKILKISRVLRRVFSACPKRVDFLVVYFVKRVRVFQSCKKPILRCTKLKELTSFAGKFRCKCYYFSCF